MESCVEKKIVEFSPLKKRKGSQMNCWNDCLLSSIAEPIDRFLGIIATCGLQVKDMGLYHPFAMENSYCLHVIGTRITFS